MAEFTAKDVKNLRDATGAGMMDAKTALAESNGDPEAATKWLREKGLSKAAQRSDRDNSEGVVAASITAGGAALVELKCETDFVAKSDQFAPFVQELADAVADGGSSAIEGFSDRIDDLKVVLKEHIELGPVVHVTASGNVMGSYVHRQDGRGVNGVLVELEGGSEELAHDVAIHIAFTQPTYMDRDDVPSEDVDAERAALTDISRAEGKPEAAMDKIVTGRMNGWYAERVLLDQKFVKEEKQTVRQFIEDGGAKLVRFEQVVVGR